MISHFRFDNIRAKCLMLITALTASTLIFTSCEVETTTVMFADDNNLSQPSDTVFSVLGILTQVQQVAERTVLLGEVRGDLVSLREDVQDDVLTQLLTMENLTDTSYNRYRDFYSIINNCNFFLSRADTTMIRSNEQVFIKEYAVVSAFRAWAYLQLAKIYGKVPFYTSPLLSYTEIENVANDASNRYGMEEICTYFIDDLAKFVDTPYPYCGDFTYGTNLTFDSQHFYLPVRLLLGELYLWRGSSSGNTSDFVMAAQYYRDYLYANSLYETSESSNTYTLSDFSAWTSYWNNSFLTLSGNAEMISFIPLAKSSNYGKIYSLGTTFDKLEGSESLKSQVDTASYCFSGIDDDSRFAIVSDSTYFGTPSSPVTLYYIDSSTTAAYTKGDLRLYTHPTTLEYTMPAGKLGSNLTIVPTNRTALVYLRLAEAINNAGYPNTAFVMLKYGLSRGNLVRYDASGELSRLMSSGYSFWDLGDDNGNIGIHALGCGNAESDTTYTLRQMSSQADSIAAVDAYITSELALETAFEGYRFFDLMRFAARRGNAYLASRVARRNSPGATEAEIQSSALYTKLMDSANWYLNIIEN